MLTYLQKVGLEERPTGQGLSGPSSQPDQLRFPSQAVQSTLDHTGQLKTTPPEFLGMEAGVTSIAA